MTKTNKSKEPGDEPRTSKRKASSQQSALLTYALSLPEMAKKPMVVAAEAAVSFPLPAEVAKGTSATNVAEEERKIPSLPEYAAVPRAVFGAGLVEAEGVAADKKEEVEEEEDNKEEDGDDDSVSGDNEEEESGEEGSDYNPDGSAGDGTVHLLADYVVNLPDKVKPSPKENVSSPFDLPILPIAKTLLVK